MKVKLVQMERLEHSFIPDHQPELDRLEHSWKPEPTVVEILRAVTGSDGTLSYG